MKISWGNNTQLQSTGDKVVKLGEGSYYYSNLIL